MRRKEALKAKHDRQLQLKFAELERQPPYPPRFEHPKNDNERLLNAQADIIEGKDSGWASFYQLAMKVAMKYISAIARKNPAVASLAPSERREKAHDAVCYIIEGYLSDDSFCITKSVTSYLWLRVRAELFNRSKADKVVDYVDISLLEDVEA